MKKLLGGIVLAGTLGLWAAGASAQDTDSDGIPDTDDNCSLLANASQTDADGDGFGNRCDPDLNNDNTIDFLDLGGIKAVFFSSDPVADFDDSGSVDFLDLGILKAFFFAQPGPGETTTYVADVQPIYFSKCAPCHTGLSVGGHDIGTTYADAFLDAEDSDCDGLNVAQCTIIKIQNGDMPQGAGCTGDPSLDAMNASCLTQIEQDLIQAWIDEGLLE